ncbi:hypothetical protein BS17DRAFT_521195 [Gyrodon lividus]|nr:hypothetical protein BS17DRAFT_521195 [Gyrodon lividus]
MHERISEYDHDRNHDRGPVRGHGPSSHNSDTSMTSSGSSYMTYTSESSSGLSYQDGRSAYRHAEDQGHEPSRSLPSTPARSRAQFLPQFQPAMPQTGRVRPGSSLDLSQSPSRSFSYSQSGNPLPRGPHSPHPVYAQHLLPERNAGAYIDPASTPSPKTSPQTFDPSHIHIGAGVGNAVPSSLSVASVPARAGVRVYSEVREGLCIVDSIGAGPESHVVHSASFTSNGRSSVMSSYAPSSTLPASTSHSSTLIPTSQPLSSPSPVSSICTHPCLSPSLSSFGIGLEEAERRERHSKSLFAAVGAIFRDRGKKKDRGRSEHDDKDGPGDEGKGMTQPDAGSEDEGRYPSTINDVGKQEEQSADGSSNLEMYDCLDAEGRRAGDSAGVDVQNDGEQTGEEGGNISNSEGEEVGESDSEELWTGKDSNSKQAASKKGKAKEGDKKGSLLRRFAAKHTPETDERCEEVRQVGFCAFALVLAHAANYLPLFLV